MDRYNYALWFITLEVECVVILDDGTPTVNSETMSNGKSCGKYMAAAGTYIHSPFCIPLFSDWYLHIFGCHSALCGMYSNFYGCSSHLL